MASQSQKPVRVGLVEQQQQQQPEQPRRPSSPDKSSPSNFFEGWNEGSLSLPSGSGLRPPHPPSPQPSPKTQLSSVNPFESRRPLRLGEHYQGALRLPNTAPADHGFFALPKHDNQDEYALAGTPTIESEHHLFSILHPAQYKSSSSTAVAAPTPTSSSSDKWSSSEASSFAQALQRERVTTKNFKKVMVAPPHLSLSTTSRPTPRRAVVSSPAITMQLAPPSPDFHPPLKSMTFSETLNKSRDESPGRPDAAHPHISFYDTKLRTRRAKASVPPAHSFGTVIHKTPTSSSPKGHHRSVASQGPRPHITTQPKSSDSIPTRNTRQRPSHPGNPVSFTSTAGSIADLIDQGQEDTIAPPAFEQAPKQGFMRVLTVHSIVSAPIKREATKLLQSEGPYRRQSIQPSIKSRSPSPGSRCFDLFSLRSRRRRSTHASVQTMSTVKGNASKRKDSYVGADGREYTHRPVPGLSFLPSEMQRVNTPPMGRDTHSPTSRSRGFFFDYTSRPGAGDEAETRRDSVAGSTEVRRKPSSP
ncbi:hypothetical protein E4T48_04227 [Aureobasidium sp. EXF-10727]|nr:hypothetical protein E4T48_04227 [Aureobasidium sp. EXF-10727]